MLCLIGAFSLLIVSYCLLFICSATTVSLVEMVSWIPFGHKIGVILFCILFYLIGFRFLHTYSNVIRFSSFVDLSHIALANIIGTLCVIIIRLLFVDNENTIFPGLRITLFAFCFGTLAMWAIRVMVKTLFDVVATSQTLGVGVDGLQDKFKTLVVLDPVDESSGEYDDYRQLLWRVTGSRR